MAFFSRSSKFDEQKMAELRAEVERTIQNLFPGVSDAWNLGGIDLHPALMIPASLAAVSFVVKTLVGSEPFYESRQESGLWKPEENLENVPHWVRPGDYHPNSLQMYDDMIGDLVVSIMISHGAYIVALGAPGEFPERVQTLPSWAGDLSTINEDNKSRVTLRVGARQRLDGSIIEDTGRVLDRYDPGNGGNYLYLSMMRWGSIPYGVDVVSTNKQTFGKHLSAIKTARRFAKNPMPSMLVEASSEGEGSYEGDIKALERLKTQLGSIGQDPENPAVAVTEVVINKIHELKQSVGDTGLSSIMERAAADMGTVHGVFDTFLSAGKSSSWGTVVRDLDRIVQSHTILPLKVKMERAFSMLCEPGKRIRFEGAQLRPETPKEKYDRIGNAIDDGLITPNEGRYEVGREKDDDPISEKLAVPSARRRVDHRGRPNDYQPQNND